MTHQISPNLVTIDVAGFFIFKKKSRSLLKKIVKKPDKD